MRAAVVKAYGAPEVVSVVERPDPVAGKGRVVVMASKVSGSISKLSWAANRTARIIRRDTP